MALQVPGRSFINKVKDRANVPAILKEKLGVVKNNRKAKMYNARADAMRAGRGIPASVAGQLDQKSPVFRAKAAAEAAKAAQLSENKRLRAKYPK